MPKGIYLHRPQSAELIKKRVEAKAGYKHSEETRKKIGIANFKERKKIRFCMKCGKKIVVYGSVTHCSIRCAKLGKPAPSKVKKFPERCGKNHHNWKGGITALHYQIRHCEQYKVWRDNIFKRDNYTCLLCGSMGKILNVDHYPLMFSEILNSSKVSSLQEALLVKDFWDTDNGRTLCVSCHRIYGRRIAAESLFEKGLFKPLKVKREYQLISKQNV